MRFPAVLYGEYDDVLRRSRAAARRIARGETLAEVAGEQWLGREDVDGLIVLHGPSPLLGGSPHYHAYLLLLTLEGSLSRAPVRDEVEQRVFEEALDDGWSVLGLASLANQVWLYPPARHRPFLRAVLAQLDELLALDPLYTDGSTTGAPLWDVPSNIKYALANLGVQTAELQSPKSPDAIERLVRDTLERAVASPPE